MKNNKLIFFSENPDLKSKVSSISVLLYNTLLITKEKKPQLITFCNGDSTKEKDPDFHPLSSFGRAVDVLEKIVSKVINIGNNVFIGANFIILKGVNIGNRSIIGVGSVMAKSIPSNQIWAGNFAKFVKR